MEFIFGFDSVVMGAVWRVGMGYGWLVMSASGYAAKGYMWRVLDGEGEAPGMEIMTEEPKPEVKRG